MNAFRLGMAGAPQAQDNESEIDPEEDSSTLSMINITVRSPLIVMGNNNLIASDTSATANSIAHGVVNALRHLSMGAHGIPMIDEQGRPRPIGVEVLAEIRVEGSQNVVGEKAVLARMMDLKEKAREKAVAEQRKASTEAAKLENGILVKREIDENRKRDRDGSEDIDADSKRARRD